MEDKVREQVAKWFEAQDWPLNYRRERFTEMAADLLARIRPQVKAEAYHHGFETGKEEAAIEAQNKIAEARQQGIKEGITMFAWWKGGVQYVGTCGTTLAQALKDIEA